MHNHNLSRNERKNACKREAAGAVVWTLIVGLVAAGQIGSAGCRKHDSEAAQTGSAAPLPQEVAAFDPFAVPPSGEGMWPWADLGRLDEKALKARGLEMDLADLWTPHKGGLALAVVGLRGCSASFVSADGLLLTNHHCAYSAIARNSTPENDLLENGFLARSKKEELDGHGIRVLVFRRQKDVTDRIVGKMPQNLTDLETVEWIEKKEKQLVAACEKKPNTRCAVSRENNGLRFLLMENLEIKDVRLVAAPPQALGSFGGEIDNWHWPRHTLDFTLLRAYVSPDGKPARYDAQNVPYEPKRYLKVNSSGVGAGDFVMVLGRPYHTARYRTAVAVRQALEWYYPTRRDLFVEWIAVLKKTAAEHAEARIPVSSTIKGLQNALTNARGMIAGLKRRRTIEKKTQMEQAWKDWVNRDPVRKKKWGRALAALNTYLKQSKVNRQRDLLLRYLLRGVKLLRFARVITKWAVEQEKPDGARDVGYQKRDRQERSAALKNAQRTLHVEADKRVLALFLRWFGELEEKARPPAIEKALKGDYSPRAIARFVDRLYRNTALDKLEKRLGLFGKPKPTLEKSSDTLIRFALALAPTFEDYEKNKKKRAGALFRLRRPYLQSLIQFRGKQFYPDANASPRVSFATVAGYTPRDGVWHLPFTTLSGLVAKHTGKKPFDAPARLLAAARNPKDDGAYISEELGDVPACFLSNADTTGGNSGSPVLDGHGGLVGLNFDRVYANISGDYGYSPFRSRNIMVDIRFILWYLDKVAAADHLLDAMLDKKHPKPKKSRLKKARP
jgi:hypothetical protein